MSQGETTGDKAFRIKRGRVDSLSLYEITDYELSVLEHGTPASLFLNFAIFFLSAAISFLTALVTTKIESQAVLTIFVVITVVGFSAGAVLMALWIRSWQSTSSLIKQIKNRIPADEARANTQDEGPSRKRSRAKPGLKVEDESSAEAEE